MITQLFIHSWMLVSSYNEQELKSASGLDKPEERHRILSHTNWKRNLGGLGGKAGA